MLHRGRGQRGLDPDAADPHLSAWQQRGADGQEHDDAQGHQGSPGKQPRAREVGATHQGQRGVRVHAR